MIESAILCIAVVSFCIYGVMKIRETERRLGKSVAEIPDKLSAAPRDLWSPMPCGTRIELSDSGFYIVLETKDAKYPYHAFSPEGDLFARGNDLRGLKRLAEERAKDRAEFQPVKGWLP